jgi:hypothetical protein
MNGHDDRPNLNEPPGMTAFNFRPGFNPLYDEEHAISTLTKFRSRVERGCPILIAGLPRHGKTYVADRLSKMLGVKWRNTSDLIKDELSRERPEWVHGDKEEIRPLLIKIGDDLCRNDPGAIVKTLFGQGYQIIAGIRKPDELNRLLHLDPFVIWVDRPGFETVKDNTLITKEYCDFVLVNDEHLDSRLQVLAYWEATRTE